MIGLVEQRLPSILASHQLKLSGVSVEKIKNSLAALTRAEQAGVTAYLLSLRHADDLEYQKEVAVRLDVGDPTH